MREQPGSYGICSFCNEPIEQSAIDRHLAAHIKKQLKTNREENAVSFLISINQNFRHFNSGYFLNLWVDGDLDLYEIDQFLRKIWLECCGHLSSFTYSVKKKRPKVELFSLDFETRMDQIMKGLEEDPYGEISMDTEIENIFTKGLLLNYDYDFGSTTSLQLKVIQQFSNSVPGKGLQLLSRNEPLEIHCSVCEGKLAEYLCSSCAEYQRSYFCPECSIKHEEDCADYSDYEQMKIFNSPRMGVCGYDGGRIDKERDGVRRKQMK